MLQGSCGFWTPLQKKQLALYSGWGWGWGHPLKNSPKSHTVHLPMLLLLKHIPTLGPLHWWSPWLESPFLVTRWLVPFPDVNQSLSSSGCPSLTCQGQVCPPIMSPSVIFIQALLF